MLIGIPKESTSRNPLVAVTPDSVRKMIALGYEVCVESGAGNRASFFNSQYRKAGAEIGSRSDIWGADIVVCLDMPTDDKLDLMHGGAVLIARMNPAANPEIAENLAKRGITGLAMDAVPRISRAQSLDVRSSMANIGGYRAVIEAANAYGRTFGGQVTAAGKVAPARVYVIGVGVAGLAAIGAAVSMGAIVSATDVRPEVADQVESLGATFVEIPVKQESSDGYARALTDEQQKLTLEVYAKQAAESDIVITTAQVPGRPAPLLLTEEAVEGMKPGSVIVDMGASELGGNCALSQQGKVVQTEGGISIIGYDNLPARLPGQASQLYGQNIVNFLKLTTPQKDGSIVLDETDEVVRGITVALDGEIMWPPPPVSVSAAPAPKAESEKPSAAEAEAAPADEEKAPSPMKGLWWKALLAILGVAIIAAAPSEMTGHFFVFELAVVVGFYVITNVTHALHTPLMSVTNAISGIIIVGSLLLMGADNPVVVALSFVAAVLASINIFGGFLVTRRMLDMFKGSSED